MTPFDRNKPSLSQLDKSLQVLAVVLIILLPLTAATMPSSDYAWSAIDPNLIYVRSRPGSAIVNSTQLILLADDALNDSLVNIASMSSGTEMDMQVEFVSSPGSDERFYVSFSSPYDMATASLVFDIGSAIIQVEQTNQSGALTSSRSIMRISGGNPLFVKVVFTPGRPFEFNVSQDGASQEGLIDYPALAGTTPVNLDLRLTTSVRGSRAILSDVVLILPFRTNRSYFASGFLLDIEYGTIVAAVLVGFRKTITRLTIQVSLKLRHVSHAVASIPTGYRRLLLITILVTPVQLLIMTVGTHPYDMFTQELWSYLVPRYGPRSVWPISLGVPGGKPFHVPSPIGSEYPYPPLPMYFYSLVGFLEHAVDPSAGVPSSGLELLIKLTWLVFLDLTAIVLFRELLRSGFRGRSALIAYLVTILNPGLALGSLVWGQFDIVVGFFILQSIVSLRKGRWTGAFFFLSLAVLSKQTGLFVAPLLIPVIFSKSGLARGFQSVGQSLIATFLLLLPWFLVGVSPAYVVKVSIGDIALNALSSAPVGVSPWQQVVSKGAFNIWPLITGLVNGQHGMARFQYPDSLDSQAFGMPYVNLGILLAVIGTSALLVELWRSKKARHPDSELLLLVIVSFLWIVEVMTRMAARYLEPILPLSVLLWASSTTNRIGKSVVALLTLVLTLSLLNEPGLVSQNVPLSVPVSQGLTQSFLADAFITAVSLTQLALMGVVVVALHNVAKTRSPSEKKSHSRRIELPLLTAEPKVSVVVLNYNGGPLVRNCISSVLSSTSPPSEILVVDNASSDDSLELLGRFFVEGRIRILRNESNLGFAHGNNRGAEASSGRLLFFLNNDTELAADAIEKMVARFVADPELGAGQPLLRYLPETDRIYSAGNTLDRLAFHELAGQGRSSAFVPASTRTSFAAGSALMIRKELFHAVGGFEPLLESYHTDSDLSWKVWLSGFRVEVVPEAIVYHAEGATASSIALEQRLYQTARNQLIMVAKNYERAYALLACAALVTVYVLASVLYSVHGNRRVARAFLEAIVSFFARLRETGQARKAVARFRKLSDREVVSKFLLPFNPIEVFHRKRAGWGYLADRMGTRLS